MTSAIKSSSKKGILNDVPNPFCGTLPDDLVVEVSNNALKVINTSCPITTAGFDRKPPKNSSPQIDGKDVDLAQAISKAASLIKKSSCTLFGGLGTDVSGTRNILRTADKVGGVVDHMLGDGILRNVLAMSDRGWIMTTLTEIKNRADLIVFIGTDATEHSRFHERVVWNKDALFVKPNDREIVYLGKKLNTKPGISPTGRKPMSIPCDIDQLPGVMNTLHALIDGRSLQAKKSGGATTTNLQKLADKIDKAVYPVFIWSPAKLNFDNAELAVSAISDVVRKLTVTKRAAGFSLGGGDGAATATAVSTWQTGYPLRVSFAKGHPEYNPTRFSTNEMLSSGQADNLVWVSTISSNKLPPETNIPTIVIGEPGMKLKTTPDVFIPAGTPGLDHNAQMIRVDSVVSLSLKQLRDVGLPSVAHIFDKIHQAL
ncbi:MAG: formylmethanofuran dehydrogenase subunit B [Gammaproteobacteria bacterium]